MDQVGNHIPDCTGDQQRRQRLVGGSAAHVIGCLRTPLIHFPRRIAGLLINLGRRLAGLFARFDRCLTDGTACLCRCRLSLSGEVAGGVRRAGCLPSAQ